MTCVLRSLRLRYFASMNSRDFLYPCWTLSAQPPHSQSPSGDTPIIRQGKVKITSQPTLNDWRSMTKTPRRKKEKTCEKPRVLLPFHLIDRFNLFFPFYTAAAAAVAYLLFDDVLLTVCGFDTWQMFRVNLFSRRPSNSAPGPSMMSGKFRWLPDGNSALYTHTHRLLCTRYRSSFPLLRSDLIIQKNKRGKKKTNEIVKDQKKNKENAAALLARFLMGFLEYLRYYKKIKRIEERKKDLRSR